MSSIDIKGENLCPCTYGQRRENNPEATDTARSMFIGRATAVKVCACCLPSVLYSSQHLPANADASAGFIYTGGKYSTHKFSSFEYPIEKKSTSKYVLMSAQLWASKSLHTLTHLEPVLRHLVAGVHVLRVLYSRHTPKRF